MKELPQTNVKVCNKIPNKNAKHVSFASKFLLKNTTHKNKSVNIFCCTQNSVSVPTGFYLFITAHKYFTARGLINSDTEKRKIMGKKDFIFFCKALLFTYFNPPGGYQHCPNSTKCPKTQSLTHRIIKLKTVSMNAIQLELEQKRKTLFVLN